MVNEHPEGKVCPLRMFQFMQDQGCIGDKCMWIWKCREPQPATQEDIFTIYAGTHSSIGGYSDPS